MQTPIHPLGVEGTVGPAKVIPIHPPLEQTKSRHRKWRIAGKISRAKYNTSKHSRANMNGGEGGWYLIGNCINWQPIRERGNFKERQKSCVFCLASVFFCWIAVVVAVAVGQLPLYTLHHIVRRNDIAWGLTQGRFCQNLSQYEDFSHMG